MADLEGIINDKAFELAMLEEDAVAGLPDGRDVEVAYEASPAGYYIIFNGEAKSQDVVPFTTRAEQDAAALAIARAAVVAAYDR